MDTKTSQLFLKSVIEKDVFVRASPKRPIILSNGDESAWIFDFRKVLLQGDVLDAYVSLFFERFKARGPFQVGGLEVAAIPLISAIVSKASERNLKINGFFIRKSRKKSGLMNRIEGDIDPAIPIILVDDVINSGRSFMEQIEVLEQIHDENGKSLVVEEVFSILRYRDMDSYSYFSKKGIAVSSLYTLDQFRESLKLAPVIALEKQEVNVFDILWCWKGGYPNLSQVRPKSALRVSEGTIYFGTDDGYCVCLDVVTGKEIWKYRLSLSRKGNEIFSSPRVCGDVIVFGSCNGNVYALDKYTGKRLWVYMEGDSIIGESCYSALHNLVFVPIMFGLHKQHGKVVAIDVSTGGIRWEFSTVAPIEGSLVYSEKESYLFFGSEDMMFYGVSSKNGKEVWHKEIGLRVRGAPCIDEENGLIVIGGLPGSSEQEGQGSVLVCNIKDGKEVYRFKGFSFGGYGSPVSYKNYILFSSLDKHLYCFLKSNGSPMWKTNLGARCFSAPLIVEEEHATKIYIGANNGRIHEIDFNTGRINSMSYLNERIVNQVVYDKESKIFFVPTFANEVYAMKRNIRVND